MLNGAARVYLPGGAGGGKTTVFQQIDRLIPQGSAIILFDCYGAGRYLDASRKRHSPDDAFRHICNDMAVRLSLPLYLTRENGSPCTHVRKEDRNRGRNTGAIESGGHSPRRDRCSEQLVDGCPPIQGAQLRLRLHILPILTQHPLAQPKRMAKYQVWHDPQPDGVCTQADQKLGPAGKLGVAMKVDGQAMFFIVSLRIGCAMRGNRSVAGPVKVSDRVKTDLRDAENLAQGYRSAT